MSRLRNKNQVTLSKLVLLYYPYPLLIHTDYCSSGTWINTERASAQGITEVRGRRTDPQNFSSENC
jgi:hypothetical protein